MAAALVPRVALLPPGVAVGVVAEGLPEAGAVGAGQLLPGAELALIQK